MIPTYLKSLAATVRDLVASGKAVHVNKETAAELDLLAGLPWNQAPVCKCQPDADPDEPGEQPTHYFRTCGRCGNKWEALHCPHEDLQNPCPKCAHKPVPLRPITPADLALGWLLASRAQPEEDYIEGPNDVVRIERILDGGAKRAAECAELAVICERIQAEPLGHITLADGRIPIYRGMTGDLITRLLIGTGSGATASGNASQPSLSPHGGTREGARAAWAFVVEQLTRSADSIEENTRKPNDNVDRHVGRRLLCADRYRRELEAM